MTGVIMAVLGLLAAEDLKEEPSAIKEECATKNFYVFGTDRKGKHPVRILDKKDLSRFREMTEKQFFVKPEAIVISYLSYGKSLQFISRTQSFARTITFVPVRVSWISQVL